jgi:hypothetical protein
MIVLGRSEVWLFGKKFAGHAKMQTEPAIAGKAKQHPFAMAFGRNEFGAGEGAFELRRVDTARHAFPGIEVNAQNFFADANIPTPPVKFDFRQFGHGRILTSDRMNCCSK